MVMFPTSHAALVRVEDGYGQIPSARSAVAREECGSIGAAIRLAVVCAMALAQSPHKQRLFHQKSTPSCQPATDTRKSYKNGILQFFLLWVFCMNEHLSILNTVSNLLTSSHIQRREKPVRHRRFFQLNDEHFIALNEFQSDFA